MVSNHFLILRWEGRETDKGYVEPVGKISFKDQVKGNAKKVCEFLFLVT